MEKEAGVAAGNMIATTTKKNAQGGGRSKHNRPPAVTGLARSGGEVDQSPRGIQGEEKLTCGTLAFIAIRVVNTLRPIQARSTGAVIDVNLADWPREAFRRAQG